MLKYQEVIAAIQGIAGQCRRHQVDLLREAEHADEMANLDGQLVPEHYRSVADGCRYQARLWDERAQAADRGFLLISTTHSADVGYSALFSPIMADAYKHARTAGSVDDLLAASLKQ